MRTSGPPEAAPHDQTVYSGRSDARLIPGPKGLKFVPSRLHGISRVPWTLTSEGRSRLHEGIRGPPEAAHDLSGLLVPSASSGFRPPRGIRCKGCYRGSLRLGWTPSPWTWAPSARCALTPTSTPIHARFRGRPLDLSIHGLPLDSPELSLAPSWTIPVPTILKVPTAQSGSAV